MATPRRLRVGRVTVYARNETWYLRYHENGRCRHVRGGTDKFAARQLAAQVNAQLEVGAPAAATFQLRVAPNGHANAARRHLRDKGVKYIHGPSHVK